MAKIRAALKAVAEKLVSDQALLARARRRYKVNHKRAVEAHKRQVKFQEDADLASGKTAGGYPNQGNAEQFTKAAARCAHRAYKAHTRAQVWRGRVKRLVQRVEGLEKTQAGLEAEREKLRKVAIRGNTASGGTKHERLKAVALASAAACASGRRPNFYSQSGAFDADHCITGPAYGHRDDCSSWFASVYKSAGLPDPSGEDFRAGYTGTLVANGKQIAKPEIGCAVVYGSGAGHHVEMYVGPGNKTIGHGSAPVDTGVIDLFGDGEYRYFKFI